MTDLSGRIPPLDPEIVTALAHGQFGHPFTVLGPHRGPDGRFVRVFLPGAMSVAVLQGADHERFELTRRETAGLFDGAIGEGAYLLTIRWPGGEQVTEDPYSYGPLLGELDLHLIGEGRHQRLADALGSNLATVDGVSGTRFAVWAPNARRVSVIGGFNSWDGRRHVMRRRGGSGIWELFIPRLGSGELYKYEIVDCHGQVLPMKADPVARTAEPLPGTASVVPRPPSHVWQDDEWMSSRAARQTETAAISIYELHPSSWTRAPNGTTLDWRGLADRLVPYAKEMGFTHIELLPVAEHPFTGSWGYQPLGLFAPTRRFGDPEDFAIFVDACHQQEIGVIVDWVPAHFPSDAHGLARFDGTALYEHEDPSEGFHKDWNTLIYNFGRREVSGFLIASALHWLEHFHVDGLRVDAVASMLYRDYSRNPGEWRPNIYGGRENLEAIDFLRHLNRVVAERHPGAIMIAEESTAWPGVTRRSEEGGLGFNFKWNMGWMHDTLHYQARDPIHRPHHHDEMTFGLVYAFAEHFILPLSHDEVVHGKGSLIGKMPGDRWTKLAGLRAYFAFMWTHPGKKLLFMGGEIAQEREWNHDGEVDWNLLQDSGHAGVQRLIKDLNRIYRDQPALHATDSDPSGFRWVVQDDRDNCVYAFIRQQPGSPSVLVVANMTPVPRANYKMGVPSAGFWREALNSDSTFYGGSGIGNGGGVGAIDASSHGYPASVELLLPPLATLVFIAEA
ncbi:MULTISPECIES: 1,4-alpha-glucan branching protein GlgB [unclassified Bosea (in: a-proteobacteria)]|uniref:1,4-alpha-glucan branching protein GlgB n=1 Tax=unclassified Bosea (in: a-proteobacteria) TaxID=2653178 RepID=UPI000F75757B|nr:MULTISPECIES: 1,4-alpha-glucan branching protein GlgB [unclassified Bosea (in: a-proteobacteria)]AZO82057.1 1,4-alpha-glucan branching enzyme [Bosea sp. Tri-49]RXT24630.1 1,4-alpha-glucan branching enzyme [Bosea sp. Tri-39]RXT42465.1 1,4-alpha-glucan branching enzyme [Bosea sp. Tri-54]